MAQLRDTTIINNLFCGGVTLGDKPVFSVMPIFQKGLGYGGKPPIYSPESDTVENWVKLGTNLFYFSGDSGTLIHRPSWYGVILNMVCGNPSDNVCDIHQVWFQQPDGDVFHRGGSSDGWANNGQWTKI